MPTGADAATKHRTPQPLFQMVAGFCVSPRRLLFGPSSSRMTGAAITPMPTVTMAAPTNGFRSITSTPVARHRSMARFRPLPSSALSTKADQGVEL
jgi:hypothetical protein